MEATAESTSPVVRLDAEGGSLGRDQDDLFLKLSALVTGTGDLDPALGREYLHKLEMGYGPQVGELSDRYYEFVRQPDPIAALSAALAENPALAAAAKQIVKIWLLSKFDDAITNAPVLAGHFERGLLWRIIDAHPPAFSARRHGYWTEPPRE